MHLIATKSQPAAGVLALRWHSSVATNQCPHHADASKTNGIGNLAGSIDAVELVNVPKLPLIGSLIHHHSGMQKINFRNSYDVWYNNRRKFGHFFSAGLPNLGKGIFREVFVLSDPNEYMKILRKESHHPFGLLSIQW